MGRTKKEDVVISDVVVEEVAPTVVESPVAEVRVEVKPVVAPTAKTQKVTITASYKTKTVDGEILKHRFSGSGDSVFEALNDVKGSDEEITDEYGAKFPSKVNLLVNVTVKRGDYQFDRAIAPQVTEAIFINKNVLLLNKLFGL